MARSFPHAIAIGRRTTLILLLGSLVLTGCTRKYYREQADMETYDLIKEKSNHPHWSLDNYTVHVREDSRMYNPNNPDRPPMPEDDPASHQLMHCVDEKKGYPGWDYGGFTDTTENPSYYQFLPINDEGILELSAEKSVELAYVHSTTLQQQLETLYLSALDVSSERFAFDTQFFGGYETEFQNRGQSAGGPSSTLDASTRGWRVSKAYSTGATMVVNFANSLIWEFSGPDTHTASTLLNFTILQPLLQRAGRDVVLERLTRVERALLANVRGMERYRRGFYLDIMTGSGGQGGLQRQGGFFGAAGLGGFTGLGGGGFGNVGNTTFFGGGGAAGAAGAQGGYLSLLQSQQQLRNSESNIASLRSNLVQLEAFRSAGRIDFFQVEQIRQQLYTQTLAILNQRRQYQADLDRFKADLGIPPTIPVRIVDDMLSHFDLIDPVLIPIQEDISSAQEEVGQLVVRVFDIAGDDLKGLKWNDAVENVLKTLQNYIDRLEAARLALKDNQVARARADVVRLTNSIPQRRSNAQDMLRVLKRPRPNADGNPRTPDVEESIFDTAYLDALPEELNQQITVLQLRLDKQAMAMGMLRANLEKALQARENLKSEDMDAILRAVPAIIAELSSSALEFSLIQASARGESVTLIPVDISPPEALEIARQYRRDWMNARASLVDSWRLVEFNADNLESNLQVVFSGDVRNTGDNPFAINKHTGSLRAGIQWDAPLTRLQERNAYRQSLIEYEQAKRRYYRNEDAIASGLRDQVRQIELNQIGFELRRSALRVAVKQVQNAQLELEKPPAQAVGGAGGGNQLGPTTAQNLITSLDSLRAAQDNFLLVWVNYEVQRGLLDLNLGTMQLDERGMWVDPGAIGKRFNYPDMVAPYAHFDANGDCLECDPNAIPADVQMEENLPELSIPEMNN